MKIYIHSNGTKSSMTEEELLAIPLYRCKCGNLFRTTTNRRTCDECMREKVLRISD